MREIKFRAWDKELKRMFKIAELNFSEWWVQCVKPEGDLKENGDNYYGERNSFKNEETDRHILMQYTGLKDKYGNGIYEGDICWDDEEECYGEVRFLDDGFSYIWQNICVDLFEIDDSIEIVGNIYEDSDLIH